MTSKATITFSQAGVQPPVYVVTSLSEPQWEMLEMDVEKDQTASANPVFLRHFDNVAEGSYQYKIRIGEDHWVLDESNDTTTDAHGNRNNVVYVKPASHVDPPTSTLTAATHEDDSAVQSSQTKPSDSEPRKDSTMDAIDLSRPPSVPIPFVVVEKVADHEQPEYSHSKPHTVPTDAATRAADAQPDLEEVKEESSMDTDLLKSSEVPLLVVEKIDDKPAHGDDFGEDATTAQKVAHNRRAADASPDKLVISPEGRTERRNEDEQDAPLFRHESFQADEPIPVPSMGTIDEVSVPPSTDQSSCGDAFNTPSDPEEPDNNDRDDELTNGPLMSHETGPSTGNGELDNHLLLSHETGLDEEVVDELSISPLLSHEAGLNGDIGGPDEDEDNDELDAAPLLSHETGFSSYEGSKTATNSDYPQDDDVSEPQHYMHDDEDEPNKARTFEPDEVPTFTRGDLQKGAGDHDHDEAPLLPHERNTFTDGSETSMDDGTFMLHGQPTFGYETDSANEVFRGNERPSIFRTRTNSSSLPHIIPPSDAEDDNLDDPSLERFPTNRQQILDRVATIGLHLPEDETIEESMHSPVMSVMSQACSSVDLAPVKSYTSLASVPEADDSDEEDGDLDSLPSPMVFKAGRSSRFARDPYATLTPDDGKRFRPTKENTNQAPNTHTTESSEAESIGKNDGTKETVLSKLQDVIATPTELFNPVTPPLTPEHKNTSGNRDFAVPVSEPQLRQRQVPKDDAVRGSLDQPAASDRQDNDDRTTRAVTPSTPQQLDRRNETFLQNFFRVVFGPVGRFLTACVSDRKRAGATAFFVSMAAAAYYVLALA